MAGHHDAGRLGRVWMDEAQSLDGFVRQNVPLAPRGFTSPDRCYATHAGHTSSASDGRPMSEMSRRGALPFPSMASTFPRAAVPRRTIRTSFCATSPIGAVTKQFNEGLASPTVRSSARGVGLKPASMKTWAAAAGSRACPDAVPWEFHRIASCRGFAVKRRTPQEDATWSARSPPSPLPSGRHRVRIGLPARLARPPRSGSGGTPGAT